MGNPGLELARHAVQRKPVNTRTPIALPAKDLFSTPPQASRRRCLRVALSAACVLASGMTSLDVRAEIPNINEAINRAGRQRMLSQRMAKAWLAMGQGVDDRRAERILRESIALFDRQLDELKGFAPTPQILATYGALEPVWRSYKAMLLTGQPDRTRAEAVIAMDGKVLKLAHLGTVQLETFSGKTLGKLVNVSGRQRMLSQRAAKFYLSQAWGTANPEQLKELRTARQEFTDALSFLREARQTTPAIRDELELAQQQWVFFDNALAKAEQSSNASMHAKEVFASSENILEVMDRVTTMISRLS
jgi:hypothetical protein